jgi:type IV pilus assembly protein PilY1
MKKVYVLHTALAALLALPSISMALTVQDDFTQPAARNSWTASGGACLTAGNGNPFATGISVIPACGSSGGGGTTGTLPDTSGSGALRLTNNQTSQHGSIVYNDNFPTDQGIQATFTTYAYNGDSGGTARLGADGISFFLLDGSLPAPADVGATGGSLGYSCSNSNAAADGITGGYIGLGMDEYGNFSTGPGDSTATAGPNGYAPNSIVLRGGGSINAAYLQSIGAPHAQSNVQSLCKNGSVTVGGTTYRPLNYPYITGVTLPTGTRPLAQSTRTTRATAIPVTYKLKITAVGLLSLWYSYNGGSYTPVITNTSILDASKSGPLPSSFRFGFSGGTGGSTNIHELSCFTATPSDIASSSGGINTVNGAQVVTGTQVYFPLYHPDNWWGQMTANPVVLTNGVPSISNVANWDASCNLTGGPCTALGTDSNGVALHSVAAQTSRAVVTSNGAGTGVPFTWTSGITATQQTALNTGPGGVVDTNGQIRLNFLRGDRGQEPPNSLRKRTGVLGDIIDSSPVWVGPPNKPYRATWVDALYPSTSAPETSYVAFANFATSTAAIRKNIVYMASNDGMVHGFQAGSFNTNGVYDGTSNNGNDIFDYVPASVISNLSNFTDPLYSHNYYVNATPGTGDLFYSNAWHTWLVGGLGPGGKAIYALDVTNPAQFSEANASSLVVGEWTNATSGNLGDSLANMGNTYGTPLIRRMHNGQWAVIFGNGFGSANGLAGIYVMTVNPTDGTKTFKWISTGSGTTGSPNGIAYVSSADLDGDRVTDYLYAGDLQGNVWRFDVTSSNTADWGVSKYGNTGNTALYSAKNSGGTVQPITTQIQVSSIPVGTSSRILLMFATGQKTPFTSTAGDVYASGTQSVYGIWDWDMATWNGGRTTTNSVVIPGSSETYASAAGPQALTRNSLFPQTLTANGNIRTISPTNSNNPKVCWKGSTSCGSIATSNTQFGWFVDLPSTGEQTVYNPIISDGVLELNSTIPPPSASSTCSIPVPTGWTMAFNPLGAAFAKSFFANSSNAIAMGIQLNAAGSPATFSVGSDKFLYGQDTSGNKFVEEIDPPPALGKRITWKQIQ